MIRPKSVPTVLLCPILLVSLPALSQFVQVAPQSNAPVDTMPANPAVTTPHKPNRPNQPRCSTEITNGDCYVNVNRLYPFSYPGFMMKRNASVTVNVFNPMGFEKLTLELSAPASVYQPTDQLGSLVTSLTPGVKGISSDGTNPIRALILGSPFTAEISGLTIPTSSTDLEKQIADAEKSLVDTIAHVSRAVDLYNAYNAQTTEIYRQVRLVSLALPRPANDPDAHQLNQTTFDPSVKKGDACFSTPDPWHNYGEWRECMLKDLLIQGTVTMELWSDFPNKCQKQDVPSTYWTAPTPECPDGEDHKNDTVYPEKGPQFDKAFDDTYDQLKSDLEDLSKDPNEKDKYKPLRAVFDSITDAITKQRPILTDFISRNMGAVPATLTKQGTDMQNYYVALLNAPNDTGTTTPLGVLYGPSKLDPSNQVVRKYLGVPLGLA